MVAVSAVGTGPASIDGPATVAVGAERSEPVIRTFTVAATGDILTEFRVLHAGATAAAAGVRYDFVPMFAPIAPLVSQATLAICHMEVPLGWPDQQPGAYGRSLTANRLLGPAEMAASVAASGFDRCSTASNHSYDLGAPGVESTLAMLDAAGLTHTGTARSPAEAGIDLTTIAGVRVAHLSYSTTSNTVLPEAWRFNYTRDPARVVADARAARESGAEVVIVSWHVGRERQRAPTADDRAFVTAVAASGEVDLVIGHGPHVIQPVERVYDTWVFWSLGNLVSGMGEPGDPKYGPEARDGLLAEVEITVVSGAMGSRTTVRPSAVLICNAIGTRTVWPAQDTFADPNTSPDLRAQMAACIARNAPYLPPLG